VVLRIAIIVMLFIAGVLAFAATKPKTFHLRRSITNKAPPDKVIALLRADPDYGIDTQSEDFNHRGFCETFCGPER
jgi:hypothetical protein